MISFQICTCTSKPQSTLRVDPYYPSPGYRRDVKKKVKLIGRGSPNVRCTSSFCVHNLLRGAPRFIALVDSVITDMKNELNGVQCTCALSLSQEDTGNCSIGHYSSGPPLLLALSPLFFHVTHLYRARAFSAANPSFPLLRCSLPKAKGRPTITWSDRKWEFSIERDSIFEETHKIIGEMSGKSVPLPKE